MATRWASLITPDAGATSCAPWHRGGHSCNIILCLPEEVPPFKANAGFFANMDAPRCGRASVPGNRRGTPGRLITGLPGRS